MTLRFKRSFIAYLFGWAMAFAHAGDCFTRINQSIEGLDIGLLSEKLGHAPEKEWQSLLGELGIEAPETPAVLERWGNNNSKLAYRSYVLKQALGQRLAKNYEKKAAEFLSSPEGQRILAKSKTPDELRNNMPQILLALAASGEVPLKTKAACTVSCRTRMGEKAYEQATNVLELESLSLDDPKVSKWVEAISDLQSEKPDLWKSMHYRVVDMKRNDEIRSFLEERGFQRFSERYRYSGSFINPDLIPIRFDSQQTLGTSIARLFATENSLCCGTSCGNCPLGFPSILKEAQAGLQKRNKSHVEKYVHLMDENRSVFNRERDVILSSIDETELTLQHLRAEAFGIYSKQSPDWLDQNFRKNVLDAEVDFLMKDRELVLRHARHNDQVEQRLRLLLAHPLLINNVNAGQLLRALD